MFKSCRWIVLIETNYMYEKVSSAHVYFCCFTHFFSSNTQLHIHIHSFSLCPLHTHSLALKFLCHTLSCVSVVVGNGLNSPHSGERDSPADRQSTMPPSVPIRKDKKDVPVSSLGSTALAQGPKILEKVYP